MVTELQAERDNFKKENEELQVLVKLAEEGGKLTQEQYKRWDELEPTLDERKEKIERLERVERVKGKYLRNDFDYSKTSGNLVVRSKNKATIEDRDNALRAWMLNGVQGQYVKDSWKRSCDLVESDWSQKEFVCNNSWKRDNSTDTTTEGNEFVNGSVFSGFVSAKAFESTMLGFCGRIDSDVSELEQPIHFVVSNTLSQYGSYVEQNQEVPNTDISFDKVTLNTQIAATSNYPVSISMILNPRTNVVNYVNEVLGARLRRMLIRDATIGDGVNKPKGILNSTYGASLAATTQTLDTTDGILIDDLRNYWFDLEPEYRKNAVFVAHDQTVKHLENKLVDATEGRAWGTDLNNAPTDQLRNRPLITNNFFDAYTATDGLGRRNVMLFGDLSHYKVRFFGGPNLKRDDSRLCETLSVYFSAWQAWDAAYVNPGNDPLLILATGVAGGQ